MTDRANVVVSGCRAFVLTSSCILVVTAVLKIISLFIGGRQLAVHDPLLVPLSNFQVLLLVATIETVTVITLYRLRDIGTRLSLVLWISLVFLCYRIGLAIIGYKGGCFCAGTAESWLLFVQKSHLDTVLKAALGYMLVGSCVCLVVLRWRRRAAPTGRQSPDREGVASIGDT